MKCQCCNQEFMSYSKLSKHIRDKHYDTIKEYYDIHVKSGSIGLCVICNSPTKFECISKGYRETCSYKCSCILKRKRLKSNPKKFELFRNKVKNNMELFWRDPNNSDVIEKRTNKMRDTMGSYIQSLTDSDKQIIFNKTKNMSDEDRIIHFTKAINYLKKFYDTATKEELQIVYKKRIQTKIDNGICSPYEVREDYDIYDTIVRSCSNTSYNKYKELINPENLTRGVRLYHLDHKISVLYGFLHNIPIEIISHPANLCIKYYTENIKKKEKCDITLQELLKQIEDFNVKNSPNP